MPPKDDMHMDSLVSLRIALIVPTLNAGERWGPFVAALKAQVASLEWVNEMSLKSHDAVVLEDKAILDAPGAAHQQTPFRSQHPSQAPCHPLPIDVVVIDSGSSDHTFPMALAAGFEVLRIKGQDFDHGGTRQVAFEHLVQKMDPARPYEWVVLMTQDALLANPQALATLLSSFKNPDVGACYGRQLPHEEATALSAHARAFNYPRQSIVKSLADKRTLGIKTAFCSDSFAAYRVSALLRVGGFPKRVILGEDMWVAAKMLLLGYKVAYVSEACVHHSHNYSFMQEFRRYFDTGVSHAEAPWILEEFGAVQGEGIRFLRSELKLANQGNFFQRVLTLLEILLRTVLKYAGYQMGKRQAHLPLFLKRRLGLFHAHWR
jgi:rhamnosyltransferase